jgi:multiple antibiotic resistance protein
MHVFVGAPGRDFLGTGEVFIILFVTFGPINFINRFYRMTADADAKAIAALAAKNALIATVAIVLSGIVGSFMLEKWRISIPAIAFTGGIALFAVAMRSIAAPYRASTPDASNAAASRLNVSSQLAFPYIATPYGIAAFIVLLALAPDNALAISITLLIVMAVDLVMMFFIKPIMRVVGIPLGLLGTVLSVLQMALSIQFVFFAIRTAIATGI